MNTKIMEGLVGAQASVNLLNTPFQVYREAERKGDTATMERAMGFAGDFAERADKYKAEADEGMTEDAEAAREKAKSEREKAIQKRKEKHDKLEAEIEKIRAENKAADTVKVSEGGKLLLKENAVSDSNNAEDIDLNDAVLAKAEFNVDKKSIIYNKTGEANLVGQGNEISVSV